MLMQYRERHLELLAIIRDLKTHIVYTAEVTSLIGSINFTNILVYEVHLSTINQLLEEGRCHK